MQYWWVNQNQTYRQEIQGGYMWSPKRNKKGGRNPFYEYMRAVAPGDLVLSFEGTFIRAVGVICSYAYECPMPPEFGETGPNWDRIGWKVDVRWFPLTNQIRPADHIAVLAPHLPAKYSPLQKDGRGLQAVYLTAVPPPLMDKIADIVGAELRELLHANRQLDDVGSYGRGLLEWEEHLARRVEEDTSIDDTTKQQIILARRGQGKFKDNVQRIEHACRITEVDRLEHLRASHIKPWRDGSANERLDGENGLLLTPSVDHLFDRGFISFEDRGTLLVSPRAHTASLKRMGIPVGETMNVGTFSEGQRQYLDYHRNEIFLEARVST